MESLHVPSMGLGTDCFPWWILGYLTYNVVSGSMEPELPVGCLVLVKKTTSEEVKEGDIIVFHRGDSVVTHRVIEIQKEERQFITKGDANEVRDSNPIPYHDLIGRFQAQFPYHDSRARTRSPRHKQEN